MTGFGDIHVIDLDTIDLSNLNRQFLFRQEHIKKPKALVAKEQAQRFNPKVKITAHHANIKDAQFSVEWFSVFKLVFNALDNLEARRHVNKMCLAADVPLIESGTTGFNGQVQVIRQGRTACYDCSPKTTPKSYPVCTIRSTPSQSIHCIVWAKSYLLLELFGESEESTPELDGSEDSENAEEIAKLRLEADALKKIRESMGSDDFAKQVFDKVFKDDVERLAKMDDMWKDKTPPQPLSYQLLSEQAEILDPAISQYDQGTWSTANNFVVFRDSLSRLAGRYSEQQTMALQTESSSPMIAFDKDDEDTLDFVTATANLRAQIFGIDAKSKFDTKQMAGNIIPAIATTNAMVAGLCVLQAFKVLKGEYGRAKMIFLDRGNMSGMALDRPNPSCHVCSAAMVRLQIDMTRATLQMVVDDILKTKLAYGDDISILTEKGLIYDADFDDNLQKMLGDLGITETTVITVQDDGDDESPRVALQLFVETKKSDDESPAAQLILKDGETFEVPRKPRKKADLLMDSGSNIVNGNGATALVAPQSTTTSSVSSKRKRNADEAELDEDSTPAKKVQASKGVAATAVAEVVLIEDDDGAIMIDD